MTSHNISYVELNIRNGWVLVPMHNRQCWFQAGVQRGDQEDYLGPYRLWIFFCVLSHVLSRDE